MSLKVLNIKSATLLCPRSFRRWHYRGIHVSILIRRPRCSCCGQLSTRHCRTKGLCARGRRPWGVGSFPIGRKEFAKDKMLHHGAFLEYFTLVQPQKSDRDFGPSIQITNIVEHGRTLKERCTFFEHFNVPNATKVHEPVSVLFEQRLIVNGRWC